MSMMTKERIECPECGNSQSTEIWQSINVTLNPELKEKFFNDEINIFTCTKCGNESMVDTNLIYHDMEKKFMVHYYSTDDEDEIAEIVKELNADVDRMKEALHHGSELLGEDKYKFRVTDSILSLMETISLFDAGLDDILIYMIKWELIDEYNRKEEGTEPIFDLLFEEIDNEDLIFYPVNGVDDLEQIAWPMESYLEVKELNKDLLEEHPIEDWFYLNDETISALLE